MIFLKNIYELFYQELCLCCNEALNIQESIICIHCRHDLPLTNFTSEKENLIEKAFYGKTQIEAATALFYFFKKGTIQHLIHNLKYKNQQQVGTFLGNWLGCELTNNSRFSTIDVIIPVPLHKKKLKSRGYNQVTTFGNSLAQNMKVPFQENILSRISSTKTQTKKIRFNRWENVQELFFVENEKALENKHILLIDDIITTGATLEACSITFSPIKKVKLSIATMAYSK